MMVNSRLQYFEDVELNKVLRSSEDYLIEQKELIGFAKQWDPLPFHIDEEAAAASPLGKLFTSSIHTVAIGVKLSHDIKREHEPAIVAGLGWDKVRFYKPVCPGDRLRVETEVTSKRESQSQTDRGIIVSELRLFNQRDEKVASYEIATLMLKKPR